MRGGNKSANEGKKFDFNLKQQAIFALGSNWAQKQFELTKKTQHSHRLREKLSIFQEGDIGRLEEKIENLRNYVSHGAHSGLAPLDSDEIAAFEAIVRKAVTSYLAIPREAQNIKEEKQTKIDKIRARMKKDKPLLSFSTGPLHQQNHPELMFLLAHFLTRKQLSYLIHRVYWPKEREDDKEPIQELLLFIAQPDTIIMRSKADEDARDTWISAEEEQGFAIWNYLQKRHADEVYTAPDDHYVMRQLVAFIESHQILKGAIFMRVEVRPDEKKEGAYKRVGVYEKQGSDNSLPLNIAYNTIRVSFVEDKVEGTFSLKTLIYITALFIGRVTPDKLTDFLITELKKNRDYSHRPSPAAKEGGDIKTRVEKRLCYLLRRLNKPPQNLQEQIRFICQRINFAYQQKYGQYLDQNDYKTLENLVRYYRKPDLLSWLEGNAIGQQSGIHMGQEDSKTLNQLIKASSIEQLYLDMKSHYRYGLKYVAKNYQNWPEDKVADLANIIGVRQQKTVSGNLPNAPVGVKLSWILTEFQDEIEEFKGIIHMLSAQYAPFKFEKPDKKFKKPGDAPRSEKNKRGWAHAKPFVVKQLLLNMAWYNVKEISDNDARLAGGAFVPISDISFKRSFSGCSLRMSFGKSWRQHARKSREYLQGLIDSYGEGRREFVLSKAEEENGISKSIERMEEEARQERLLFIQAILDWEKGWLKKNKSEAERLKTAKGYVEFREIAEKESLPDTIKELRNKAFHDGFLRDTKFSDCVEPIKSIYEDLKQKHI